MPASRASAASGIWATASAQVSGGAAPAWFADVATRGPTAVASAAARGASGQRAANVPVPAVTASGTPSDAGRIRVSGPGQKRLDSR